MSEDTTTIAKHFTALCSAGEWAKAGQTYWADSIVSREPFPGEMSVMSGRAAVEAKSAWWSANHTVHAFTAEGPFVFGDQFAVRFTMDVTPHGGTRSAMKEVGLYTVEGGKIVEERFLYGV